MSHFTVLVKVTKDLLDFHNGDVEEAVIDMLAPYQENNMGDCPQVYLKFHDIEDKLRKTWENDSITLVELEDGERVSMYDNRFNIKPFERKIPESAKEIQVPYKELYPTFEEFAQGQQERKDGVTGKYGYWENPNAKWDWWVIGGRWSKFLTNKNGEQVDYCKASDLDIEYLDAEVDEKIDNFWKKYQLYLDHKQGKLNREELDSEEIFAIYDVPQTLRMLGIDEEDEVQLGYLKTFHRYYWEFGTFAVLDKSGWQEKGEMGWFGCSSTTPEGSREWDRSYMEVHIKYEDPETTLVIVDCHV
jgi:hypothetical protein